MFTKVETKKPQADSAAITKSIMTNSSFSPLLISAPEQDIRLEPWLKANKEAVINDQYTQGAILFRGFNIDNTDKLERFSSCFVDELLPYVEKRSPRTTLSNNVYSSTIYPADQIIHFHNTTSFSHQWPMKIFFCCFQPAEELGYTPITDCRAVLNSLSQAMKDKFAKYGVMYVRNFQKDIGLTWQHTFDTHEKSDVEAYCKQHNIHYEWLENDVLRTRQVRHAIAKHPITNDMVWFNQAIHFNVKSLISEMQDALLSTFTPENLPRNSYFGNGDPIDAAIVEEIKSCYDEHKFEFPWEKGDVMLLDNMLTAHARTTYKGDRLIALSLGEMYEPAQPQGGII